MCTFIDEHKEKYKLLLFPRGHLKSTLVTVGRTVQAICENPKTRVLIANATYFGATAFLEQIKAHLKTNKKLHDYYGDLTQNSTKWNENMIKVFAPGETADYEQKEATVTAMGVGGSLTGQHYDIIICDDLVNRENITTLEQIQKVYRFYQDCLDLLEPGGELIIIGTRWHDVDLYGWIMDGDSTRQGEIPKHLSKQIMPYQFYFKGDRFNIMKRKVVEGDKPIWPEKFTLDHVASLKKEKGPYEFSTQYNNEPIPDENQTFNREWFKYYIEDDLKGANVYNFTMCDPAISQEDGADFTVIMTIAVDPYQNWWIREIIRRRMLPNEIIDELFKVDMRWKPAEIGLEIVAYQKMLSYSLREEMMTRKKYLPLRELKPSTRQSKESRIKALQPGYSNGKIFHKEMMPNLEYLEDELMRFPRGAHDDIIDTLAYFTQFAFPPKLDREKAKNNRKRRGKRQYLY